MRGERLIDLIQVEDKLQEWPAYYVRTNAGVYEYTGQSFVKRACVPKGSLVKGLDEALNKVIREVRGDGESAVILLDSSDIVVFSVSHDPFGSEFRSWPTITFCSANEAASWRNEYEEMDLLDINHADHG